MTVTNAIRSKLDDIERSMEAETDSSARSMAASIVFELRTWLDEEAPTEIEAGGLSEDEERAVREATRIKVKDHLKSEEELSDARLSNGDINWISEQAADKALEVFNEYLVVPEKEGLVEHRKSFVWTCPGCNTGHPVSPEAEYVVCVCGGRWDRNPKKVEQVHGFSDFAEAWCSGWNSHRDNGDVDAIAFTEVLMDAFRRSGSQMAKKAIEEADRTRTREFLRSFTEAAHPPRKR